jgi:trehalose synthase
MQRGAAVVFQKSIREGFGLTVSEALWKEKAMIGSDVGGIRYQIRDGWDGYLVRSVEGCVERVDALLADPWLAREVGRRGRETVREEFLFTRLLDLLDLHHALDELERYSDRLARLGAFVLAPVVQLDTCASSPIYLCMGV